MVRRLAIAMLATAVTAAAAGAIEKPTLTIERSAPLVVRGIAFHARELVTLTSSAGRLKVRVGVNGSFLASFPSGDRCTGGRIIAVGTSGDRVVLKLPPAMCAPAKTQATPG